MVEATQGEPKPAPCSSDVVARPEMPSLDNVGMKLRVRQPTSPGSSQASADDIPLFMASKPMRRTRRSLSPIDNRTPRKTSRQSEPDTKPPNDDPTPENMAWEIIAREISEWQKVCQTGRPSWWSPVPDWTQGDRSVWPEELHALPPWCMNIDHARRFGQCYDEKRRALTDGYLADNNNVQDLARLIAVQLLGACFTLPPEHMSHYKKPAYHIFDTPGSTEMPGSWLISSLRMHAEARHSPSFGHQARNTSPAYRWQGAYDGPSPSSSLGPSSDLQAGNSNDSRKASRRRRLHRALHVTEGSTADCSTGSHLEFFDLSDVLRTAEKNFRYRLKGDTGADQEAESSVSDRNTRSCPSTPSGSDNQVLDSSRFATEIFRGHTPDALGNQEYSQMPDQPRRRTLQSVIRSEPHHVYIQPVKQLVVKRWRTIRRRFGYSSGYVHHDPVNRKVNTISPMTASSRSAGAEGSIDSPALSSEGKGRRRKARESGDIHSNNIDSNPRYNTSISAEESGVASPEYPEHPSVESTDTKSTRVSEATASGFVGSGLTAAVSLCFTPPNSLASSNGPSPAAATTESPNTNPGLGHFTGPATSISKPLNSPPTSSARRHGQRRHQKSNLSEICTPEDIEDRSVVSALGGPLASPREESGSDVAAEQPGQIPKLEKEEQKSPAGRVLSEATASRSMQDEMLIPEPVSGKIRRPSIVRTSTSGTQVFTPSEDGVELDGLPTGPPSETWNEQWLGNKRKERSFL